MDDPTDFVIVEQWDTRQHYETYLQWRTDTGVLGNIAEKLDGEPSIRSFIYFGVQLLNPAMYQKPNKAFELTVYSEHLKRMLFIS